MGRIKLVIAAALLMVAMLVATAVPAFATDDGNEVNCNQAGLLLQSQQCAGDDYNDPDVLDLL